MQVLLTSVKSNMTHNIAAMLARSNTVTVTDKNPVSTGLKFVRSDLGHDPSINNLVQNMDVIIHSLEEHDDLGDAEILDRAMRCTYNLLLASVEEHVPRFIFISSLALMDSYDKDHVVTESWKPIPSSDPATISFHLAEFVCREFSLEKNIHVIVLRFGNVVFESDDLTQTTSALHIDDAINALDSAINTDMDKLNNRRLFHIQSKIPNARYITEEAEKNLGYRPITHT